MHRDFQAITNYSTLLPIHIVEYNLSGKIPCSSTTADGVVPSNRVKYVKELASQLELDANTGQWIRKQPNRPPRIVVSTPEEADRAIQLCMHERGELKTKRGTNVRVYIRIADVFTS